MAVSQQLLVIIANSQELQKKEPILEGAKLLKSALIETSKLTQTLMSPNAVGIVPYELALRAESLISNIQHSLILKLDTVSAQTDLFAKNAIFSSEKVHMLNNIQVYWQLTKPNGELVGSGVDQNLSAWDQINFPK